MTDILTSITKFYGSSEQPLQTANPFFKAMNQETVVDLNLIGAGRLGSFLRRKNIVGGDGASIIDATLDFFLGDKSQAAPELKEAFTKTSYSQNFIPIILKTEFNMVSSVNSSVPLYIVFDSTPESIKFTKSANWVPKDILGRPEPVWTYSHSNPTTISLTGDFYVSSHVEHLYKLKLSDYIMSLASPSKYYYMPSPVQVMIGEWKQFRAIVNNVDIDFKGPWYIRQAVAKSKDAAKHTFNVPSYAPYFFTATISLTLVSPDNEVNYAEDVIDNAGQTFIGYRNEMSDEDLSNIASQMGDSLYESGISSQFKTGAFQLTNSDKYTFSDGVLKTSTDYTLTRDTSFNIFEEGNNDRRRGDLAVISNAVSNQLSKILQKAF
jgi:hypothetical protein